MVGGGGSCGGVSCAPPFHIAKTPHPGVLGGGGDGMESEEAHNPHAKRGQNRFFIGFMCGCGFGIFVERWMAAWGREGVKG